MVYIQFSRFKVSYTSRFQYSAVASLATEVNAPPIPAAVEPTPIDKNFAEVVPVLLTEYNEDIEMIKNSVI